MHREVENFENLLIEAHRMKGAKWAQEEPLWCTWTLEKFGKCYRSHSSGPTEFWAVTSIPALLIPYHRSLHLHKQIIEDVRSHSTPFEKSKEAINKWADQPFVSEDGWDAKWEDICALEVERWDK